MSESFSMGVCLLHNPELGDGAGVFARNGELAHVASLSELSMSAGILWCTNIPYETFANRHLYSIGNVRNDQFLRTRIDVMLKELGLGYMSRPDQAVVLSQIAQSFVDYAAMLTRHPIREPGPGSQRMDWILRDRLRPKALYPNSADAEWLSVARTAFLSNYATPPLRNSWVKRQYTVPRTAFARQLLQGKLKYPDLFGKWTETKFDKPIILPGDGSLPAELRDRAAFVLVTIRNMPRDRMAWAPFTQYKGRGTVIPRSWIALPEAQSYARDCVVEIERAYWTGEQELKLEADLPPPEDDALLAANLYAESAIYSCGQKSGEKQRRGQINDSATGHEALAAYVWAYERAYLAKLVPIFQERQIGKITTVGSLQLQVQMEPSKVEEADQLACSLGLEVPMQPYETQASGVPISYVKPKHEMVARGSKDRDPFISAHDWIHNEKALVRWTTFSLLKAFGTIEQMLEIDTGCASSEQTRKILSEAAGKLAKKGWLK